MPSPARKRSSTLARPASESRPILAVALALIGAFILVAMVFHSPNDLNLFPQWLEKTFGLQSATDITPENNPCGSFGATVAVTLFSLFGYTTFLVPLFLFASAWFCLNNRAHTIWPTKVTLMSACVLFGAPIVAMWLGTESVGAFDPKGAGGVLGAFLYLKLCQPVLGDYGTWILIFPYGFCLLGALSDDPKATLAAWIAELRDTFGAWNAQRKAEAKLAAEERKRKLAALAEMRRVQVQVAGVELEVPPKAPVKVAPEPEPVAAAAVATVSPDNVTITPEVEVKPVKPPRQATEPLVSGSRKVVVV